MNPHFHNLTMSFQLDESWRQTCEKVFLTEDSDFKLTNKACEAQVDEQARPYRRSSLQDPGARLLKMSKYYEEKDETVRGILKRGASDKGKY